VIAFVRIRNLGVTDKEDGDLCFISATATAAAPNCVVDPKLDVTRPAWSPDGQAILVSAKPVVKPLQSDLLEYTSNLPSSGNAKTWTSLGLVTTSMHGSRAGDAVDTAAWSPDQGKQVAFGANWKSNGFHLVLVDVAQDVLKPKTAKAFLQVRACEVAYLTPTELVVNQRDNTCGQAGVLARLDVSKPDRLTPLSSLGLGAEHPVLSPTPP